MPAARFLRWFGARLSGAAAGNRAAPAPTDPDRQAASLLALQEAAEQALARFDAREIRLAYDGAPLRTKPWKAFAMPKLEEARTRARARLPGGLAGIGLDDLSVAIDVEMDRHIAYGQGATPLDAVASLSRR